MKKKVGYIFVMKRVGTGRGTGRSIVITLEATNRGLWIYRCSNIQKHLFPCISQNRCSWKFCKIDKITTVSEFLFNKVTSLQPETLLKKRLRHRCFTNFAKILRTPFSYKSSGQLLLNIYSPNNSVFCLPNTTIVSRRSKARSIQKIKSLWYFLVTVSKITDKSFKHRFRNNWHQKIDIMN